MRRGLNKWMLETRAAKEAIAEAYAWHRMFEDVWHKGNFVPMAAEVVGEYRVNLPALPLAANGSASGPTSPVNVVESCQRMASSSSSNGAVTDDHTAAVSSLGPAGNGSSTPRHANEEEEEDSGPFAGWAKQWNSFTHAFAQAVGAEPEEPSPPPGGAPSLADAAKKFRAPKPFKTAQRQQRRASLSPPSKQLRRRRRAAAIGHCVMDSVMVLPCMRAVALSLPQAQRLRRME